MSSKLQAPAEAGSVAAAHDGGSGPARKRRSYSDAKHGDKLNAILRCAAQLFATHGYDGTSLDSIGERMGIHKATLYHYVSGKDDILYRCLLASFADLDQVVEQVSDRSVPVVQRLRYFVGKLAAAQNSDFGRCQVMVGPKPLSGPKGSEIRAFQRTLDQTVRGLIAEGVADGSLRPCNQGLVAAMLFGALNWVPQWYKASGPLSVEQISDAFVAMLVQGVGVPGLVLPEGLAVAPTAAVPARPRAKAPARTSVPAPTPAKTQTARKPRTRSTPGNAR